MCDKRQQPEAYLAHQQNCKSYPGTSNCLEAASAFRSPHVDIKSFRWGKYAHNMEAQDENNQKWTGPQGTNHATAKHDGDIVGGVTFHV
eukprot:CAMPEP_0172770044 /NCGR_PEP_ID=MMETSP1074-20121228/187789_1 /TAXON_ID=2916 /ORGANISM="Ceratium fusus, Strain PA161109" /LENGTH=88 /DNA_ID=CAMNT_0013605735 /DNA_START=254 /DNA_END=520 /DNA_ORIENTATION=+